MNQTPAAVNSRYSQLEIGLFINWLFLRIRSRTGFKTLIALARLTGIFAIWMRFLVSEHHLYLVQEQIFLFIGMAYALVTVVFSKKIIAEFDTPRYHLALILIDAILISIYIFFTSHAPTDLYLFYFIPLISASHFIGRRQLIWIACLVTLLYLAVELIIFRVNPQQYLLTEIFLTWAWKSAFLVMGTLIFRAQRSLPSSNTTTWVVSPAKAREKLEEMLEEASSFIPFTTATIQMIYRDRLMVIACRGFKNRREIYQLEFPTNDARFPNQKVIETKSVQVVPSDEYPSFQDGNFHSQHVRTWMGAPLISPATDECYGMISFDTPLSNGFNNQDRLHAKWFSQKISNFLMESALSPAALTQSTNRENLLGLLKSWADILPNKTAEWDDDAHAARELVEMGKKIFHVEDCSIFFLRHKFFSHEKLKRGAEEPVLHLIVSTSIPKEHIRKRDMKVTGLPGDGLTGLVVHRNRILNYGAKKIYNSPYRANFTDHLDFMFSKKSRQVMISPLHDSKGQAVGAIKIENRMGTSSEREFFPVERDLFELYSDMVSLILETIRQRNYIKRLDENVHGMRGIVHHGAIAPLKSLQEQVQQIPNAAEINVNADKIVHALEYVKMVIHRVLSDSVDKLYLEKEGLIHAIYHDLKSIQVIPDFEAAASKIEIFAQQGIEEQIPYDIQEIFFNIAHEGILNIVRHSQIDKKENGRGQIRLAKENSIFEFTITDNGVGFDEEKVFTDQRWSFGLNNMKDQMRYKKYRSIIASIDISSHPNKGTIIKAQWLPEPSSH